MGCYDSRPDIEVVIYHTNDSHSRVDAQANSDCIGFAKIATIKNNTPNSVLVDAGDTLHGLPIATLSQGESIVRMMNAAGYDYMTTGNHDYNYGLDRLLELEAMAKFKLLVANVVYKADNSNVFAAWDIKNFDGLKVGFFGLATSDTLTSTVPANVEDLIFEDSVEIARECVTELKNRGCRAIVAITHLGDTSINGSETSQLVASNVDGIDVIIDGHSHSTYPDGKKVNDTIICSTGNYLNNLGRVSLSFTKGYLTSKEARLISAAATVDTEEDAKQLKL
jgi:5''-nucleotidase/2'',3''-cyclic phosphodiesterase and related esterases